MICFAVSSAWPHTHSGVGKSGAPALKRKLARLILPVLICVAVRTVLSYPSIGLGQEVEGGLVLAGEECQGVQRGLVERGGGDT